MGRFVFVLVTALLLGAPNAFALERPPILEEGAETPPLLGWVGFCERHPEDCKGSETPPSNNRLKADSKTWGDLQQVNNYVNRIVISLNDIDHYQQIDYWTYPTNGFGDCEDYVLEKRRMLLAMGYPREALLITTVVDKHNQGHAVLTVLLESGDYVLDNLRNEVLLWHQTGHYFQKRQSRADDRVWLRVHIPLHYPLIFGSFR